MDSNIFIYATPGKDNVIYHTITNPDTGKACYPDILIKHSFEEKEIADSNLYQIADNAIRQYGSSRCYFVTYRDEELMRELTDRLNSVYKAPVFSSKDNLDIIECFANSLMLSATMTNSLRTLLIYYGDFIGDLKEFTDRCRDEYKLPVINKNEGKKIYELIRQKILCQ